MSEESPPRGGDSPSTPPGSAGEVTPPAEPRPVEPAADLSSATDASIPAAEEPLARVIVMNKPGFFMRRVLGFGAAVTSLYRYFVSYFDNVPTFRVALIPFFLLCIVLYARGPWTNYIFDEQEALRSNPYVNATEFRYREAIYRDFWGLPPNGTIGSYRPVPNYLWRGWVEVGERLQKPFDKVVPAAVLEKIPADSRSLSDDFTRSFFQQWWCIFFHAMNGAIFSAMAYGYSKRRKLAWFAGAIFVTAAVLTEAVSGCVGLADILGGMGALLALASLGMRAYAMPFAVFLSVLLGLFSKESAIVCVPLVPFAALISAPVIHPERPARIIRMLLSLVGAASAFVLYVEVRKLWFPSPLPSELKEQLPAYASKTQVLAREFMIWFHQPTLPHDPLNNPFADPMAGPDDRLAGALRVYERGAGQVVFPWKLSGDYSAPQEPVPDRLIFLGSIFGAILMIVPLAVGLALAIVGIRREVSGARVENSPGDPPPWTRRLLVHGAEVAVILGAFFLVWLMLAQPPAPLPDGQLPDPIRFVISTADLAKYGLPLGLLAFGVGGLVELFWKVKRRSDNLWAIAPVAIGSVWMVISYFPHSNIPALLPTVRAERFWYFPVIGTTMILSIALYLLSERFLRSEKFRRLAVLVPALFIGLQGFRAYWQATSYRDDLVFWRRTKDTVGNSAKAHLNYSVMLSPPRGTYEERLKESLIALDLSPEWPMAHVYTGDTLCRMHRAPEAWPYYLDGFRKGPNDKGLLILGLQCLFDEHELKPHEDDLRALARESSGSWFAYLAIDILDNGDKNGGIDPQYRPGFKKLFTPSSTTTTATSSVVGDSSSAESSDPDPSADSAGHSGSALEVEARTPSGRPRAGSAAGTQDETQGGPGSSLKTSTTED